MSEDVQIFKAKIRELEVQCAELAAQKDDANQKLTKQHKHSKELSIQINQLTDDLNEAEQIRNKHQQTLEKNRDLI